MKKLLVILFLFYGLILQSQTTWYIATTGNDGNPGTFASPWKTLAHACFMVTEENHKIHVKPGLTYVETTQSILAEGVSIEGEGAGITKITSTYNAANEPLIKAESYGEWGNNVGNQSISGITFDGNNLTTSQPIQINFRSNVKIYDCVFQNFKDKGVYFFGMPKGEWGGVNPYEAGFPAPDHRCFGNEFHNNIVTNCSVYNVNGTGNLGFGQQDGMIVRYNVITQTARAAGSNGYGIKFVEDGWNINTDCHDNTITIAPNASEDGFNFAIEMWYEMGGCEYYDNIIQGCLDFDVGYKGASTYSFWIHDNIIGFNTVQNHTEIAINIEATCKDVIVNNNYCKNIALGILFSPIWPNDDHPNDNEYENIKVFNNKFTIGEVSGGWTSGAIFGIHFSQHESTDKITNCDLWNNTIVSTGDWRSNTYEMAGIMLPQCMETINFRIRNNIIKGFAGGTLRSAGILAMGTTTNTNLTITHNLLYGNSASNLVLFTTGIGGEGLYVPSGSYVYNNHLTTDPLLSSDYHLTAGSPAIRSGVTGTMSATDYDGLSWLSPPSRGCYEYTTSSTIPTVTTTAITDIQETTATGGGNVTSDGGDAITARGVCWSLITNPTIADSKTTDGTGTGSFVSTITPLINGTTYHVRAYATNTNGTSYGADREFTTTATPSSGVRLLRYGDQLIRLSNSEPKLIKTTVN